MSWDNKTSSMSQDSHVATPPPIEEGQCSTTLIAKECGPKVKGIHPVKEAWIHGIIIQYEDLILHRLTPTRQQIEHYIRAKTMLGEAIQKRLQPMIYEDLKEYNSITFTKKVGSKYNPLDGIQRRHNKKGYKQRQRKPCSLESPGLDDRLLQEIAKFSGDEKKEALPWINLIESFGIFSYQIYRAQNFSDILAACIACLKMNIRERSITEMLIDLSSLFTDDDCSEPIETEPHEPTSSETDEGPKPFFSHWICSKANHFEEQSQFEKYKSCDLRLCFHDRV